METAETIIFTGVSLFVLAEFALAYRYTISPKAGERMAEADRRFKPSSLEDPDLDWGLFFKIYAAIFVLRMILHLGFDIEWAGLLVIPGVVVAIYLARKKQQESAAAREHESARKA